MSEDTGKKLARARKPRSPGWYYQKPSDALQDVRNTYHYWSGKITDCSYTLALAVIGANWAVFGSVDKLLQNRWAQSSLATEIVALGMNLYGMRKLSEDHRRRMNWAEEHAVQWRKEFNEARGKRSPWPFTQAILNWGRFFRECRAWLPIIGGLFFLIALFTTRPNQIQKEQPPRERNIVSQGRDHLLGRFKFPDTECTTPLTRTGG